MVAIVQNKHIQLMFNLTVVCKQGHESGAVIKINKGSRSIGFSREINSRYSGNCDGATSANKVLKIHRCKRVCLVKGTPRHITRLGGCNGETLEGLARFTGSDSRSHFPFHNQGPKKGLV